MGSRQNERRDRRSKECNHVYIEGKFYYAPTENTLNLMVRHPESQKLNHFLERTNVDTWEDNWIDSKNDKQLEYCKEKFKTNLPIFVHVNSDEVATTNQLDS
jgi:hypothetical protein